MKRNTFVSIGVLVCILLSVFSVSSQNTPAKSAESFLTGFVCEQDDFIDKIELAVSDDISPNVDGVELMADSPAVILGEEPMGDDTSALMHDDTLYIPVDDMSGILDYDVIIKGDEGKESVEVDGKTVDISTEGAQAEGGEISGVVIDNKTYVPVSEIADLAGYELSLEDEGKKAILLEKFQSKRLFAKINDISYLSDPDLNDVFKTAKDIAVNSEGLIFAEFATEEETKNAYDALEASDMVKYTDIDNLIPVALDSNYTWGTNSCNFNGFIEDNPVFSNLQNEVSVAVVDTGLNSQDSVFSGRIIYDGTQSTSDPFGHGTHVAGIVAATTALAGNNVKICPYKLEAAEQNGQIYFVSDSEMYTTIHKAAKHDVINMSLSMSNLSLRPVVKEYILASTNTLFVVSAGNDGKAVPEDSLAELVSGMPNGVVVTAIDKYDAPANFSSYASKNAGSFIAAPGVGISSTYYVNSTPYTVMDGTSMAAPHVAGACALLRLIDENASPSQIKNALFTYHCKKPNGWSAQYGAGKLKMHYLASGTFGEGFNWSYSSGILTIKGTGTLQGFETNDNIPWKSYMDTTSIVSLSGDIDGFSIDKLGEFPVLREIRINDENTHYCSVDGAVYTKDQKTLVVCPPLLVKGEYEIPEGTVTIAKKAFLGCPDITSVVIPESVNTIFDNAFDGCTSLCDIYYKGTENKWNLITKGEGWNNSLGSETYSKNYTLNYSYIAPDYMGLCGENAVWKVWKSSGILRIEGKGATYDFETSSTDGIVITDAGWCEYENYIKTIEIKDDITVIGKKAFYVSISCTEIVLGKGVTTVREDAFDFSLEKLTLSESFEKFEGAAFKHAWELKEIQVDENNKFFTSVDGVVYTKDGTELVAYPSGRRDNEYIMPEGVKKIRNDVFNDNRYVQRVTFCEGFEEIGDRAFMACYIPFDIVFPDSLKSIGESAFESVTGLMFTGFPEGFETLGDRAFAYCQSLHCLTVPKSIKYIGSKTFYNCTGMSRMYFRGTESQWNSIKKASDWDDMWAASENIIFESIRPGRMYDDSGTFGTGARWYFWSDVGYLSIEGKGAAGSSTPLKENYKESVKKLVVEEGVTAIGDSLFFGFINMESAELPTTVTSIGSSAFQGCASLEKITIRPGLKTIGDYAFLYCQALKNVVLPSGVTAIPAYAFGDCYALESIKIPETVTSIGEQAFRNCGYLNNVVIPSKVSEIKYRTFYNCYYLDNIKLPEGIKTIGANAFESCPNLVNIELPEGVNSIGNYAFRDCSLLEPFTLPKELESITNTVFQNTNVTGFMVHPESTKLKSADGVLYNYDLTKLIAYPISKPDTSFTVPSTVTQINSGAFQNCVNLEKVVFEGEVAHIPNDAFYTCEKLQSVEVNGVESIGDNAFYRCTSLVSFPNADKLVSIGKQAFYACRSLAFVDLQNAAKTVGTRAFYGCALKKVIIGESVETIESEAFLSARIDLIIVYKGKRTIATDAFSSHNVSNIYHTGTREEWNDTKINVNTSYTTIIHNYDPVSESISGSCNETVNWHLSIATGALTISGSGSMPDYTADALAPWNYPKLVKSIEIGENITSTGNYAFYKLTSVADISLPENLESIGMYSFSWCTGIEEFTIPSKITTIPEGAFAVCTALGKVNFPPNLQQIRASAFSGCDAITEITLPDSLTVLGSEAFYGCDSLEEITIPDGIKRLEESTFSVCKVLKTVNLPDTLEYIGKNAFYGCFMLEMPTFPSMLQKIEDKAFYGCYVAQTIEFPESLTKIGPNAFEDCERIQMLIFNKGISWIGLDAFGTREDIKAYYSGTVEEWNEISDAKYLDFEVCVAFDGENYAEDFGTYQNYQWQVYDGGTLLKIIGEKTFNSNLVPMYLAYTKTVKTIVLDERITGIPAQAFKGFTALETFTMPETITSLGSNVFNGCTALTNVDLSLSNISSIGTGAFQNCNKLKTINLPSSLSSIGTYAFSRCSSLTDIKLPSNMYNIGNNAFEYCSSLTSIKLPRTLMSIANYLFYYCSNLSSIEMSDMVSRIGNSAFYGCGKLSSIEIPERVSTIGTYAFSQCDALTEFKFPERVTTISDGLFSMCNNLTKIEFPSGVTSIGNNAFEQCMALTEITIPEGVASIGNRAFSGCSELNKVYIPSTVTSFGTTVFSGSPDRVIYYSGTREEWNNIVNSAAIVAARIIFSSGSDSEDTEVVWSYDSKSKRLSVYQVGAMPDWTYETLKDIPWREHYGSISEIYIGPDVTHIGDYSFYGCGNVYKITIDEKNTNFKLIDKALYKTTQKGIAKELVLCLNAFGVTSLKVSYGTEIIRAGAFENNRRINNIVLPDSLLHIGERAFENCTSLVWVTMEPSVREISDYAFSGCENLETISYNASGKEWSGIITAKNWDYNMGSALDKGTQIVFKDPGGEEVEDYSINCDTDGTTVTINLNSKSGDYSGKVMVVYYRDGRYLRMNTYYADTKTHSYTLYDKGNNVRVFWFSEDNLKPICQGVRIDY